MIIGLSLKEGLRVNQVGKETKTEVSGRKNSMCKTFGDKKHLGNKVWSGYSVGTMGKDGKNVAKTMP